MTVRDERVAVNGATLHVRLEGASDAPTVVLAHSLGTNLTLWDAQIPALLPRWRVLRYDARGHGGSDAPPGPYSIDTLAGDVLALLAHFAIPRAHLVGVSLGALTAIAVALRHPPQLASIAVCDTRTDMSADFARAIQQRNDLVRTNGITPVAEVAAERWLSPTTRAQQPDLAERVRAMTLAVAPDGFIACAEAVRTAGLDSRLAEIRVPALFVAGTEDAGLPVAVMRTMQMRVPGSRFAEIAHAGHLAPLEQPGAFNPLLVGFLAAH